MTTPPLPGWLGPAPWAPEFAAAFAAGGAGIGSALSEEVGPRVVSFPMLTGPACARLLAEVDRRVAAAKSAAGPRRPPNSMHAHGAVLGELGFGAFLVELRTTWIAPLARAFFADVGGADLDGEYGFLAEYGAGADEELGYHVDDSAVTLNLCLGGDFSGSELYFRGLRCDRHRQTPATPTESFELEHVPGTAILHAGRHRHGVHPLRRGRRRNLILWCRSATATVAARGCPAWCGAAGLR